MGCDWNIQFLLISPSSLERRDPSYPNTFVKIPLVDT